MPVTGRRPKPDGQARTRHPLTQEWRDVPDVPFAGGLELPESRPDGRPWPERTKQKWDAWRAMPHAALWGPAEWDYALDSIEVAAKFHVDGDVKYAVELRNREKVLGTTLDFLRALRIRYVEPKPESESAAGVTNIADYREL